MPDTPLTLVILAAGRSTRFGRLKQLAPVGPSGEALLDYAIRDAARAGFANFVLVVQEALRPAFDEHLRPAAASGLGIGYAFQSVTQPAPDVPPPPGRTRPWGTGHAVLAAAEHVNGPFAVCNADDFYGRRAYESVAAAMRDWRPAAPAAAPAIPRAVTVGYPLATTLSDAGGVSRGICRVDAGGTLRRLVEGLDLRRDGDAVTGRDPAGRPVEVATHAPVCTNLWGFEPTIMPLLRDLFAAFAVSDPGPEREFYLSEAVNDLIAAGRLRCAVLPARDRWLGVTFPDDHAEVAESLRALVDSGAYSAPLWNAPCS